MKNQMKKHLLKATSVGMAAMMAATPLTVFAEDTAEGENVVNAQQDEDQDKQAEENVQESAEAMEATKAANGEMDTLLEMTEDDAELVEVQPSEDADTDAEEEETGVHYAEGEISDAQGEIDHMKEAGQEVDGAIENIDTEIDKAIKVADEAKKDAEQKEADYAEKREELANATTVVDAESVKSELDKIAKEASENYNGYVKNYNDILDEIDAQDKAVAAAQKKFDDAKAAGVQDLKDAQEELDAAMTRATELKEAAEAAQEKVAGAEAIIEAQKNRDNDTSGKWQIKQKVFLEILKNYYVPVLKGGTLVKDPVNGRNTQKADAANVGNRASVDGNANNYKVEYKDANGNKVVEWLDYKWDDDGNLIIFPKNSEEIDVYRYKDSKNKYHDIESGEDGVVDVTIVNKNKKDIIQEKQLSDVDVVEVNNEKYAKSEENVKYLIDEKSAVEDEANVKDSEITSEDGKVTVTTTVALDNDDVTYASTEDGKVVKTVKGEVTTVTKTESTLSGSTTQYTDKQAAINAAQAARDALEADYDSVEYEKTVEASLVPDQIEVPDVKIEQETHYSASETFAPQFTLTIDINEQSNGWLNSRSDAVDKAKETARDMVESLDGYHVCDYDTSGITVADNASDVEQFFGVHKYRATGKISVTFTKATKVSDTTDIDFLDHFNSSDDVKNAVKEQIVDPNGGFDYELHKWNLFEDGFSAFVNARYSYYKPDQTTVSTDADAVYTTEADAKAAATAKKTAAIKAELEELQSKLSGTVTASGTRVDKVSASSAEVNVEKATTKKVDVWTIGDVNYTATKEETAETEAKTTYNAQKLEHIQTTGMYGNDAYDKYLNNGNANGIIMFEKTDEGLNKFLADYTGETGIIAQANKALTAYTTAKEKVADLQDALDKLENDAAPSKATEIAEKRALLQVELDKAQADMDDAEEALDRILGQLDEVEKELDAKIKEVTPKEDDSNNTTPTAITPVAEETTSAEAATPVAASTVATDAAPAAVAPAAVAPAVVTADAALAVTAPAGNLIAAQPVPAPMDQMTLDGGDDAAVVEEEGTTEAKPIIEAGDVDAARANLTLEDEVQANTIMGWWWLLIIALLGGTGYTMYRKHQQKKAAQTIDKTK